MVQSTSPAAIVGKTNRSVALAVDYREAGRLLGVSARTIWALVDAGELPAFRVGRAVRIEVEELHRFIARRTASEVRP